MSAAAVDALEWARAQSGLRPYAQKALETICALAKPDYFAGAKRLAAELRTSERAARVLIADLARDGFIWIRRRLKHTPLIRPNVGARVTPHATAAGAWEQAHRARTMRPERRSEPEREPVDPRQLDLFDVALFAESGADSANDAESPSAKAPVFAESDSADLKEEKESISASLRFAGARARVREAEVSAIRSGQGKERGTPIAPDWRPSPARIEDARKLGLDPQEVLTLFRAYYLGLAGPRALSCDWDATFLVWCMREARQFRRPDRSAPERPSKDAWWLKELAARRPPPPQYDFDGVAA